MRPTYTIGQLAREAGVPISTLRYYERRGLLCPEARSRSNYRVYGPGNLAQLRFIRAAQGVGLQLDDIALLLQLRLEPLPPCADVQSLLDQRLRVVEIQLEELTRLRRRLRAALGECRRREPEGRCSLLEGLEADR